MARLVIEIGGERRVHDLAGDRITIGRADRVDIVLSCRRVADQHLILLRHGQGFRAVASRGVPGFVVNGERAARHDLQSGDRLEVGTATLEFVADEEASVPASGGAGAVGSAPNLASLADQMSVGLAVRPRPDRAADRRPRERKPKRSLAMTSAAVSLAAASVFLAIKLASSDPFGKSARSLVTLAETQASQRRYDSALATLAAAQVRDPGPDTRDRIDALDAKIASALARSEDEGRLTSAWNGYRSLLNFEKVYLGKHPDRRPACRELVRRGETWLDNYGELCAKYEEHVAERSEVVALVARYRPAARLHEPDGVDDVLFQAKHRVQLKKRRYYREALQILDDYLQAGVADRAEDVRALRTSIEAGGERWLQSQLKRVGLLIERREFVEAGELLDFLRERGLAAWGEAIAEVAGRLEAASGRD